MRFDDCLERQFNLCQSLEDLADSLPSSVDTLAAIALASRLHPVLYECHQLEESVVFPALLVKNPDVHPLLDRLRREHFEDEDHACDVRDAITTYVATRSRRASAGEVGYMLRGLFMPLRRHLAFDRDYILPLYRQAFRG